MADKILKSETLIVISSVEQLKEFVLEILEEHNKAPVAAPITPHYVHGLAGIQDLLNVNKLPACQP